MTIRAIQTRYAGCHFRSRLEARWAVFFDALGIEWQYEPQGFETEAGPYLPDFYLPATSGGCWVEIKGVSPTYDEFQKLAFLSRLTDSVALLLVGDIPKDPYRWDSDPIFEPLELTAWGTPAVYLWPGMTVLRGNVSQAIYPWTDSEIRIRAALTKARSARFEHGENG